MVVVDGRRGKFPRLASHEVARVSCAGEVGAIVRAVCKNEAVVLGNNASRGPPGAAYRPVDEVAGGAVAAGVSEEHGLRGVRRDADRDGTSSRCGPAEE